MSELWRHIAQRAGTELDEPTIARLNRFLDLLLDANRLMNLTRITDRAAAELSHVADSLTLLPHLPPGDFRLADVGSGGGAPGIPLAIACPRATVLLIESTRKKAAFLERCAAELGLTNVAVAPVRAESVGHDPNCRERFDVVTARAVGPLAELIEWCLPLCRKGGKVLAMKGPRIAEELPAALRPIRAVGGAEPIIHPVELPGAEGHVIVEIRKITRTDRFFPRDPTRAKGRPIP